jgi:N-acetylmuramoyl-L-alanine amidase
MNLRHTIIVLLVIPHKCLFTCHPALDAGPSKSYAVRRPRLTAKNPMNLRHTTIVLIASICLCLAPNAFATDLHFTGTGGDFSVPSLWTGEVRMVELESLGGGLNIPMDADTTNHSCTWTVPPDTRIRFDLGSAFVALPQRVIQFNVEVQRFQNHYYAPLLGTLDLLSDLGYSLAYRPEMDQVQYRRRNHNLAENLQSERQKWAFDVIVLDPGHGGVDPGAIGKKGTCEKTITLQVAKRLKPLLEQSLNLKVVMTRDRDIFVPLSQRGQIANQANGKLFISLHCNASRSRRARGIETYFLAPARRERALKVALTENSVIKYEQTTAQYPDLSDENYILTAMAQSHFMRESEALASVVQEETSRAMKLPNRGVDQAGFYVLIGASMPGILFEMGFLSHPKEEMLLRSAEFQSQLAQALCRAIETFVSQQGGT